MHLRTFDIIICAARGSAKVPEVKEYEHKCSVYMKWIVRSALHTPL